jgi:hypothetical protein
MKSLRGSFRRGSSSRGEGMAAEGAGAILGEETGRPRNGSDATATQSRRRYKG